MQDDSGRKDNPPSPVADGMQVFSAPTEGLHATQIRNLYVDIVHQDLSTSKEEPRDTNFIWYTTSYFMPEYDQNSKGNKKREKCSQNAVNTGGFAAEGQK